MFTNHKVGGIRFVRIGTFQLTFCRTRRHPTVARSLAMAVHARAERVVSWIETKVAQLDQPDAVIAEAAARYKERAGAREALLFDAYLLDQRAKDLDADGRYALAALARNGAAQKRSLAASLDA